MIKEIPNQKPVAIMRTPTFRLSIASIAALLPMLAAAQQTPPPPPQLEKLEEGEAPAITIRKEDSQRRITEKKEGGRVTEIKVQSGKSTYYLKPNEQPGNAQPGDAQSNITRPAQWKVLEFDLGGTVKQAPESQGTPDEAPLPPAKK
jgi:hypothetical protein